MGTLGKPVPGAKTKIEHEEGDDEEDEGIILGWGRNLCMGYLNRECESKETLVGDGWMKLADAGRIDSDGFLVGKGREAEDAITLRSGEQIMPQKVSFLN